MNRKQLMQQGFTLIEIIIVLVLLGILAATAIPKYFDMQKTAQGRAAQAAVAEVQARVNMTFAQNLLKGSTCQAASDAAILVATGTATATDLGGWKLTTGDPATTGDSKVYTVSSVTTPTAETIPVGDFGLTDTNIWNISVPTCTAASTTTD